MRRVLSLGTSLSLFLFAATSLAITEPNGVVVPRASSEETLDHFFTVGRGEPINWLTDAQTMPNSFSPLCGFTATFVMNAAGSKFGLAWYNETGVKPLPSEIHNIVPAGATLGTAVT